jgi:hypothetical protein
MQRPTAPWDSDWRYWLERAPPVIIDEAGDAFLADARRWLDDIPHTGDGNIIKEPWKYAPLASLNAGDFQHGAVLINAITRYQMALLKCKEDEVSLGTDRLQQAIASTVFGTMGASIATKLGLTTLIASAAFAATGAGVIGIGYAIASVRRNSIKARRNRIINEIYDALETVIARLSYQ